MANRRMIHRKISLCEQLADCSCLARLLYTWGLPHTSDWGVLPGSGRRLKALILPLSREGADDVERAANELIDAGLWSSFEHDGAPYVCYPTFDDYQEIRRRSTAQRDGLPLPPNAENSPEVTGTSRKCTEVPGSSRKFRPKRSEGKGREGKRTEGKEALKAAGPAAGTPGESVSGAADGDGSGKPEEPDQVAIREAWEALELGGTPRCAGYGELRNLVKAKGLPFVRAWIEHLRANPQRLPDGAEPGRWFVDLFRGAMKRPWEWQRENGRRVGPQDVDAFGEARQ